ncbi:MAG: flippase [Elusimicrobia bacterium]|nr:flippase [Elusimicrobiota bacterium]
MNSVKQKIATLLWHNRTLGQTVLKNTFWLFSGQAVSRLIKLALIIYAARILGAAGYGSFAYALAFVSLAFIFSDLGVLGLLMREYNKLKVDKMKLVANTFYIKTALLIASVLLTLGLSIFVQDPTAKAVLIFIVFMYLVSGVRDFFISIARAKERMEIESAVTITESTLTALLGFWFLFNFASAQALSVAYLLGAGGSLLLSIGLTFRFIPKFFQRPDLTYIKKILSLAWPFALGFVVAAILTSTDTVMLGFIKTPEIVGQYSVGVRVIQVLLIIPALFSVALLPSLSRFIEDKKRLLDITKKALSYIMMLGVPLLLGGVLTAPQLIPKIFGIQYELGILSFQILLLLMIIIFPVIIFDYILLALNLQVKNLQYTVIAATANIFLNLLLIPLYSLYGAALATVLAQGINLALTTNLIKKTLGDTGFQLQPLVKFILASMLMAGFIWLTFLVHLSLWFIIPSAVTLYFILLYLMHEKTLLDGLAILKTRNR